MHYMELMPRIFSSVQYFLLTSYKSSRPQLQQSKASEKIEFSPQKELFISKCYQMTAKNFEVLIDIQIKRLKIQCRHQLLMQEGQSRVGVLKVFKTKTSNQKPGNHNLPLAFLVRFQKGMLPKFTSYKNMRQQFHELLLDYFEDRIILRDAQTGTNYYEDNQCQYFAKNYDNYRQLEKSSPTKELKHLKSIKARKNSPKRDVANKQVSLSVENRPVRSRRLKSQLSKEPTRELLRYQKEKQSYQISQSLQEYDRSVSQKANPHSELQIKKILDYDHLIEESACLNLVSPAVISSIKPKHDSVMRMPAPYHLPQRISFKEPEHEQYSSEEFKESDSSEFLLDDRGKEKRRKEKLMRQQEKMRKKKKVKRLKKNVKGKGKAKL